MDWNFVVLDTDARQRYICDYLPGKKQSVAWRSDCEEEICIEWLKAADCIILPTPVAKLGKYQELEEILKANLIKCRTVFGGGVTPKWESWCSERNILCYDLMREETVAQKNAAITAEATVAEILQNSLYSISGQKIVVTGYGRCGRTVANLLAAMGAKVTVLARGACDRKRAKADGHNAVDFSYAAEEAYGTRTFVNTVPARVITGALIGEMHPKTLVVDIASAPGGCDLEAAKECDIKVVQALGLPARYTTKSSAKVFADAICSKMLPNFIREEEHAWTFQIIL